MSQQAVTLTLSAAHRHLLSQGSGIADDVIEARGYRTLDAPEFVDLVHQGLFQEYLLKADGWLAVPVFRPDGARHCEILRLDTPIGNSQKYMWPVGSRNALDLHPFSRDLVDDTDVPLIVTEGIKKGDALLSHARMADPVLRMCVVAINGCWGWRSSPIAGAGTRASQDWEDLVLLGRQIILIPDSDYHSNPSVRKGWDECAYYLASKTNKDNAVTVAVPPANGFEKQGADDFLLEHTLTDLLSLARNPRFIEPAQETRAIHITWADKMIEMAPEKTPVLVENMTPERSVNVIAGHTQTMKTWLALTLGFDAALQQPWHSHPMLGIPKKFRTLYINKEMGEAMFAVRFRDLYLSDRYYGQKDEIGKWFGHSDEPSIDFSDPNIVDVFIELLSLNEIHAVVLDSLSMVWSGDENKSNEVGELYKRLRLITSKTGVVWYLLHHLNKPSRDRQGVNAMFNVRGSGQIIQQADSALLLSVNRIVDENTKEIAAYHAKGRATGELPAWIFQYSRDHDSGKTEITYCGNLSDYKAKQYAESRGDTVALADWVMHVLRDSPSMFDTGLRRPHLVTLLDLAWPADTIQAKPSKATISRSITSLVESGSLQITDKNQRLGDLVSFVTDSEIETVPASSELLEGNAFIVEKGDKRE